MAHPIRDAIQALQTSEPDATDAEIRAFILRNRARWPVSFDAMDPTDRERLRTRVRAARIAAKGSRARAAGIRTAAIAAASDGVVAVAVGSQTFDFESITVEPYGEEAFAVRVRLVGGSEYLFVNPPTAVHDLAGDIVRRFEDRRHPGVFRDERFREDPLTAIAELVAQFHQTQPQKASR